MQFVFALVLAIGINASALAQPLNKCFLNAGLKDQHRVYLTINGTQFTGAFIIDRNYDTGSREIYRFSGTTTGNTLNVNFTDGKTPATLHSEKSVFVWAVKTTHDKESLRITLYGKNYISNQHETYTVDYETCMAG